MRNDLNINCNNNPFSFAHGYNQIVVKICVCFLLFGLAYRLFSRSFIQFMPVVDTDSVFLVDNLKVNESKASHKDTSTAFLVDNQRVNESKAAHNAKCDIFRGEWVVDPTGPFYTNESCHSIGDPLNCIKNGRPDSGYSHWRWNPRDCELPKFNPKRFLDLMRNKSMAFIGDSISSNHAMSFICILSQVEQAVEVYHNNEYKSKKWYFPSHHFAVSIIWSAFLIKATNFEDNVGFSSLAPRIHLDKLDSIWAEQYKNFDYIEIGGGKWFLKTAIYYENNTIVGCHNCPGDNLTELGFDYAYQKAIQLTLNFIARSNHTVHVIFRTTTPDHFENGEWNTGGYCNRTVPFKEGDVDMRDVDKVMQIIELQEFEKAVAIGSQKGLSLKLFNTTHLSLLRPDGHPGPYKFFQPFAKDRNAKISNDCLHWCLPGPIDSWNDLMMEMMLDG